MTQEETVKQIIDGPEVQQMLRQGYSMRITKEANGDTVLTLDDAAPAKPMDAERAAINPSVLYWAEEIGRAVELTPSESAAVLRVLLPGSQHDRFVKGVWTMGEPESLPRLTAEETHRVLMVAHLADYSGTLRERRKAKA